ncbi:bola-like protein [Nemania sp. FL0916]|nr:bola-like protein [Nemania sp. FL0916]
MTSTYRSIAAAALRQAPLTIRSVSVRRFASHIQARNLLSAAFLPHAALPQVFRYSTTPSTNPDTASTSNTALPEKPDYLNDAESAIWEKLVAEFSPTALLVQDISGGCGSMYGIEITSEKFCGATMLKQQRMVNAVLGEEMKSWHGIQLRTRTP